MTTKSGQVLRQVVRSRSDEWVGDNPNVYLKRLRDVCRRELSIGSWSGETGVIFSVGVRLDGDVPTVRWLRDFSRGVIEREVKQGETVYDPIFHIYNLTVRTLEQMKPQEAA